MTILARHLTFKGRVQRVFYRNWTVATAQELGLTGWVRNRMNGDVEAIVQGDEIAVARFIALAWDGPPAARIDDIQDEPAELADFDGFEQRATV